MQLDSVLPVFEIKIPSDRDAGQLTGLAQWNESKTQLVCDCGAEDEAPRLDSNDKVDIACSVPIGNSIDSEAEAFRIEKKGRDVAELNSWLGVVGNRSDVRSEADGAILRSCPEESGDRFTELRPRS